MNLVWKFIAWILTTHNGMVGRWLIMYAQKTPYFDLPGYMERWWVIRPRKWLPFAVRIHHILRADWDRHPHNHPWNFRSIVLDGWYREESLEKGVTYLRMAHAGDTYKRTRFDFHRITQVSEGGVWTLFITGKKSMEWGFMVGDRWVYWKDYLGEP